MATVQKKEFAFENIPSIKAKTLRINLNPEIYGTFAEIGAGQETARHYFIAGTIEFIAFSGPGEPPGPLPKP